MKRAIVLLALAPCVFGACSMLFTHGPPQGHEKMVYFTCSESSTGPILDIVWGGLNVAGALVIAGHRDEYDNPDRGVATGVIWGIISGISAGVGFDRVKKCRAAKRQLAERQARAPARADEGVTGRVRVSGGDEVRRVEITPHTDTLTAGNSVQLAAKALDENGGYYINKVFRWSSSNDAIASVSNSGLVTAHAPGSVVIAANADNVVGTANVLVSP